MPEYTVMTLGSVVAVVALELLWFRTRIFASAQYWVSIAIVFAFQIAVDGWLTKLSNPIVVYNPSEMSGLRVPWDIPVEDFGFGFTMVTLAILLWRRSVDRHNDLQSPPMASRDISEAHETQELKE
jgi:lycopene cyclase domain-containing protein